SPPGLDLATCCERWASLPLLFEPGTEWNYSVASDVLGRVLEIVSGRRLDELFAERIFAPLGMTDTGFFVAPADAARLAGFYLPHRSLPRARGATGGVLSSRRFRPRRPKRRLRRRRPPTTARPLRRRWSCLLRGRLPPVHPDDPERWPTGRGPPLERSHRAVHVAEPPAGAGGSRDLRSAVRRGPARGRRLRSGLRRARGLRAQQGPLLGRRALLGRGGEHRVLHRPCRRPHRGV